MSQFSKLFKKAPVQVQNRNGFDLGHSNFFSGNTGTLIPIVCHPVIPDTYINYGYAGEVQLPPLATDAYGRIKAKVECFFIPNRLLFGGWKHFIMNYNSDNELGSSISGTGLNKFLPQVSMPYSACGPGTLADYLGLQIQATPPAGSTATTFQLPNPLKFLAYHKVWQDHYMNTLIQRPAFINPYMVSANVNLKQIQFLPFVQAPSPGVTTYTGTLYDGTELYSLRQRNWPKDYFTNSTPKPQNGNESSLKFNVDSETSTGEFTIAALRAANSLQLWLERNNIPGNDYAELHKARYGVYPADAITDKSIFLGDSSFDVYNKSVYQTNFAPEQYVNPDIQDNGEYSGNPFASVGAKYASPQGIQTGHNIVNNYHVTEHGYFMVLFSLVPQVTYSGGVDRDFHRSVVTDFADGILASIGDQPIDNSELVDVWGTTSNSEGSNTFGYTQRFSEYKFIKDQTHGILSDGNLLSRFALQRSFGTSAPELGTDFIEIPTNYLDQITAFQVGSSYFGYWANIYNNLKISTPLPAYSIPTLGLQPDTHTELVEKGGNHL